MRSSPSLLRRLAAILYDAFLLLGLLFAAAAIVVAPLGGPPTSTTAIGIFRVYLVCVAFLFFGWFWTHGGQTLGMRAWRLQVIRRKTGQVLDWRHAALRFGAAILSWACLGLGFFWVIVDRDRLTWHDRLSDSELVLLPKTGKDRETAV